MDTENATSDWSTDFNRLYHVEWLFEAGDRGVPRGQPVGWNLTYGPDGAVATFDDLQFVCGYAYHDGDRLKEVRRGANVWELFGTARACSRFRRQGSKHEDVRSERAAGLSGHSAPTAGGGDFRH